MAHAAVVFERTVGQADPETVSCYIELLRLTIRKNLVIANVNKRERDHIKAIEIAAMNKYARAKLKDVPDPIIHPSDKQNFKVVGLQATDVSRRLDRLTLDNPEAALHLSRKCYKLVALTDLIVAGEIDPTKVLHMDVGTAGEENSILTGTKAEVKKNGGGSADRVHLRVAHRDELPQAAALHIDALDISRYNESKL